MIACSMSTVHESVRFKRRACRLSPRLDFSAVHADACRVCCPSRPAICSRRPRVCVPHGELLSGPCTPIAYRASGDRARNRLRATATAHWQLRPARAPLGTRLTALREFLYACVLILQLFVGDCVSLHNSVNSSLHRTDHCSLVTRSLSSPHTWPCGSRAVVLVEHTFRLGLRSTRL